MPNEPSPWQSDQQDVSNGILQATTESKAMSLFVTSSLIRRSIGF